MSLGMGGGGEGYFVQPNRCSQNTTLLEYDGTGDKLRGDLEW